MFWLWKKIILKMEPKKHLTQKGLDEIVSLKASLNKGLFPSLKNAFPNVIPAPRPPVENIDIPHGGWLAGFASGKGCFFVSKPVVSNSGSNHVQLVFHITQHKRDAILIKSFINYFGCGTFVVSTNNKVQLPGGKFTENMKIQEFLVFILSKV